MNSKNIKENTWYKIKSDPYYPHFLAKKLHKPGAVIASCRSFLVEGIHVSSHTQDDRIGIVRYFRPSSLIETTQPKAKEER